MYRVLVTGGAGFIGSNFVRYALRRHEDWAVTVLDKLTYAGRRENLADLESNPRFSFVHGDVADLDLVDRLAGEVDAAINFAAETHVDRSLLDAGDFINTDVYGAYALMEAAKRRPLHRVVQVSTDEVYGSVESGHSLETDRLNPRNPYSASKAGGELMVQAYYQSFKLPVIVTRGSNNFGPYHYPEKVIPLFITNAIDDLPLPMYGDGLQIRDWIYVLDHCSAIDLILEKGTPGEIYNIGGGNERTNRELTNLILKILGKPESLIQTVEDRPGHDRRYSVDTTKLRSLGWQPSHRFEDALADTVKWYQENEWWWRPIKSGEYTEYYQRQYGERLKGITASHPGDPYSGQTIRRGRL